MTQTMTLQVDAALIQELNDFARFTGFSLTRCANESIAQWLQTTAIDYVQHLADGGAPCGPEEPIQARAGLHLVGK